MDEILLEVRDDIAKITLNRPPHNAMNEALLSQLFDACQTINENESVRLTVVRGAGDFAFCAGGDAHWMVDQTPLTWNVIARDLIGRAINAVAALPMPVVAAIDGHALGGGFELALACDMILATRKSRLGVPEVRLGVFPGGGGTVRLMRTLGMNLTRELVLTGRALTAEEAHTLGVVNRVVDDDGLDAGVEGLANELRKCGPQAVRLAKRSLEHASNVPSHEGLNYEADLVSLLFGSDEQREGFRAFIERRPPAYRIVP